MDEQQRPKTLPPTEEADIETMQVVFAAMSRRHGSARAMELLERAALRAGLERRRPYARPRRVVAPGVSGRPSSPRAFVSP